MVTTDIYLGLWNIKILFHGATASPWPETPYYRSFTIILRHTTLSSAPLDELSARRRDLYLKKQNIHKRQTFLRPAGFEPTIPANEFPQTQALDSAATEIVGIVGLLPKNLWRYVR